MVDLMRQGLHTALSSFFFTVSVLLFGILLALTVLPYDAVKSRADAWGRDGKSDFFTPAFYRDTALMVRGAACSLLLAALVFRRRIMRYFAGVSSSSVVFAGDMLRLVKIIVKERGEFWALLIITAAAAVMRALYLDCPMRYDEAAAFTLYSSEPLRFALTNYAGPGNHLFHTLLVHLTYVIFGNEPWIIRLPAFISGILLVPLSYVVIRLYYDSRAALMAAALVAASAALIEYSTSARGYAMICLSFMLLLGLALYITRKNNTAAWLLFSIVTALGFYTIPIMLYPFGIVFLWLLLSSIWRDVGWSNITFLRGLLCYSLCAGILTMIFYAPVFVVSGYRSVVANNWVLPLPLPQFLKELPPSLYAAWSCWNRDVPTALALTLLFGFLVSIVFHRKVASQRMHFISATVLFLSPVLAVQRVVPSSRIWSFLLPLYLGLAAAGLCYGLKQIAFKKIGDRALLYRSVTGIVLLVLALSSLLQHSSHNNEYATYFDGEKAALFLKDYLKENDRVLVFGPVNMPLRYYFNKLGISDDFLFKKLEDSDRVLLIENYPATGPVETLEEILLKGRVDADAFGNPQLIKRFDFSSLYEVRRVRK